MEKSRDLFIFQSAASLVHWDMETVMPPKGIKLRSLQLAMLRRIGHKMSNDPEIGVLLKDIMEHPQYESLDSIQRRNIFLIKKHHDEETKLPEKLVVETAKQEAVTIDTWKKAKAAEDFSLFRPELEKLINLKKKSADILMKVKKSPTPYDALIDIFEPNMTAVTISRVFDELKEGLVSIINKCEASQKQQDISVLKRKVPFDIQRNISNAVSDFIGYDAESKEAGGRIDETEHPFTTGYYDDVRITTHYYEDNFASAIFSVLHEGGHALYEQNLRPDWMFQPVGTACSFGFHESQSRFVENIIGRSREFWSYFLPKLNEVTRGVLSDVEVDRFIKAVNQVRPSKIRVEADEVTYCLHIIIRFSLERDIFADRINMAELPEVWNERYSKFLGLNVENDSEGVMQDTHWASGLFGYFPSYALGNIYSGQLLAEMERELPDWRNEIALGNFKNVKQWLINNVYMLGNLYDPADLIKKVTGEELNVKPYLHYLNKKYSELYGF
ncbi:MAG: carboxypeptidase M32 [Candidatus Aminicenantaceae bacterium]